MPHYAIDKGKGVAEKRNAERLYPGVGSDGHCNLRLSRDKTLPLRHFRDWVVFFHQVFQNQLENFLYVFQRLLLSKSPRRCPNVFPSREIRSPTISIRFYHYFKDISFHFFTCQPIPFGVQ